MCSVQAFGQEQGILIVEFSLGQGRDFWWLIQDRVSNSTKCWSGTGKDMGLINKVDMVCLSPVGYVV